MRIRPKACVLTVFIVEHVYCSKVLPEQLELSQIFRKHELF